MPPPPPAPPPPAPPREISRALFWGIAGQHVRVPAVGCRVAYLPEGHIDQVPAMPDFSGLGNVEIPWAFPCVVLSSKFSVEPQHGEVFVEIHLRPSAWPAKGEDGGLWCDGYTDRKEDVGDLKRAEKTLTYNDTHIGELDDVPQPWATSILPVPINDNAKMDLVEQSIVCTDALGTEFRFRHIFSADPVPWHRFTDGWSSFVEEKRLVPGDSVVFLKREGWCQPDGVFRIGIHRGPRLIRRDGREWDFNARVLVESVSKAVTSAMNGEDFWVAYFPRRTYTEPFVVPSAAVLDASDNWEEGTEVVFEGAEGIVRKRNIHSPGWPFKGSLYRCLLVEGTGADGEFRRLSPWQVKRKYQDAAPLMPGGGAAAAGSEARSST